MVVRSCGDAPAVPTAGRSCVCRVEAVGARDVVCGVDLPCSIDCADAALCRCEGTACSVVCPEGVEPVECEGQYAGIVTCDIEHCDNDPYN